MEKSFKIQSEGIKEVDILVGIPSYNNSRTIGHVVRAVIAGLAKYFPKAKAVLVNSDGGSTDGTQEEVKKVGIEDFKMILTSHPGHPIHKIVTPYHGIPGKGTRVIPFIRSLPHIMGFQGKGVPSVPFLRQPNCSM